MSNQWRPIASATKREPIIYLADCVNSGGEFIGEAVWRDRDGEEEGWWDTSITHTVRPKAWMPRPKYEPFTSEE